MRLLILLLLFFGIQSGVAQVAALLDFSAVPTEITIVDCFTSHKEGRVPKRSFQLYWGGGASWESYRDRAMSPLLYEGLQGAAMIGVEVEGAKVLHRVESQFWFGETSAARRGGTTENLAYALNGSYLRRLNPANGYWIWRAGPAFSSWGSLRYHTSLVNSNYFYDLFLSLGASGAVERPFRLMRRQWSTGWQLSVPVLSWGLRPTYSGLVAATPEEELTAGPYLEEARAGTFGVLSRVQSRLHLRYALPNENAISLLYYWEVFRSDLGYHKVTHAMNGLQLNLSIKLSR